MVKGLLMPLWDIRVKYELNETGLVKKQTAKFLRFVALMINNNMISLRVEKQLSHDFYSLFS